jgi:hypothetical protein
MVCLPRTLAIDIAVLNSQTPMDLSWPTSQVYDARALRVIVGDDNGERVRDAVETCYKLVSTVHSIWKPIPNVSGPGLCNKCTATTQTLPMSGP